MSKSKIHVLMGALCLVALLAVITGCEKPAAKEPAAAPAKETKVSVPAAKEAATPAAEKPKEAAPAAPTTGPGPHKFSANWMDEPGFITNWLIVGPFPNPGDRPTNAGFDIDYLKNYGGEANHTPANGMEIKKDDGTVVKWQQYQSTDTLINFFDVPFLNLESGQEDILCYAACWLESDADKDVEIRVGSDDGYKLWLNHAQIATVHEYRAAEMDQETYKVKLNKGKNLVLIKVDQDYGEFEFMLRVVNSEGKEVPGITAWN
jgi:hypothetical protein